MTKIRQLSEIAAEQWGMVTTAQARGVGVTPQAMARMARVGDLVRLAHGVYRLAGSRVDLHDDLRAAWLGLDPGRTATERIATEDVDVVSHRSAALLLGLGDLDADFMEFTVQRRRQTRRTDLRLHRSTVGADDWALIAGIPATTPRRTIADLAAARIDRGHLATVVRDAIMKHDLATNTVAATLARHARGYGVATGDGQGLVTLLLREAGVAQTAVDVVVRGAPEVPAMQLLRYAALEAAEDPEFARWVAAAIARHQAPQGFASGLDPEILRTVTPATEAVRRPHRSSISDGDDTEGPNDE